MKSAHLISCLILLFLGCGLRAQDELLSQYYNSPLVLNPALTGSSERDYRIITQYRNQWNSISDAFRTMGASYDMAILRKPRKTNYFGAGAYLLNDLAGKSKLSHLNAGVAFAWHMSLSGYSSLSAGINVAYRARSIRPDGLAWDSQYNGAAYDPSLPTGENFTAENTWAPDACYGLLWQREKTSKIRIAAGISGRHFFQRQSFLEPRRDVLYPLHTVHGSLRHRTEFIEMEYLLRFQMQSMAMSGEVGAIGRYRIGMDSRFTNSRTSSGVLAGAMYRYADALIIILGYEFKRTIELNLSYDITLSKLARANNNGGGPEISLSYSGWFTQNRIKLK